MESANHAKGDEAISTTETESNSTARNGGGQLTAENRRAEVDGEAFVFVNCRVTQIRRESPR